MDNAQRFAFDHYTLRRKVLKLAGGAFHIYGPDEQLVMYSKQKAFRLREDIRLYDTEEMTTELLTINTQSVFDIAGTYDVVDATDGSRVGALRRQAMKSMIRDSWLILDPQGNEIGRIEEDSTFKALARRFVDMVALLMPQTFSFNIGGQTVATAKQNYNLFVRKLNIDLSTDVNDALDPRLALAAGVLLLAIEGRQN